MYALFRFKSVFFFFFELSLFGFSYNFLHKLADIHGNSNSHRKRRIGTHDEDKEQISTQGQGVRGMFSLSWISIIISKHKLLRYL